MASDTSLLDRWIERRDAHAFREIVVRYAALVHGACLRVLRNDADAQDAAQICFIKLARADEAPTRSLGGWLHAMAVRASIDLKRARERRSERERRYATARRSAGDEPSWDEVQSDVDVAIAELPESLRRPIVDHFLRGRTHDAIAAELGVSRQTVTHRIGKGVEQIRRLLRRRGWRAGIPLLVASLPSLAEAAAPPQLTAALGRLALSGVAPAASASAAPGAAHLSAKIGVFLMTKKLVVSAGIAVLVVLGIWFGLGKGLFVDEPHGPGERETASVHGERDEVPAATRTATEHRAATSKDGADVGEGTTTGTAAVADSVRGLVVDASGSPAARCRVAWARIRGKERGVEIVEETRADENGRFVLAALSARDARSTPRGELFACALQRDEAGGVDLGGLDLATSDSATDGAVTIALEALSEIGGAVFERATEAAVSGVRVQLRIERSGDGDDELPRVLAAAFPDIAGDGSSRISSTDGRYRFTTPGPLRARLQFDSGVSDWVVPGFRSQADLLTVGLAAGERRLNLDFGLDLGGSIAGRVVDVDGAPIEAATVELEASYRASDRRVVQTDVRGEFRFHGLATQASYLVAAWSDGLAPGFGSRIAMPEAQEVIGVEIVLGPGRQFAGRVVDDRGEPLPGVSIALAKSFEARRVWIRGVESLETGDDGSFEFAQLAAGEYVVGASSAEHDDRTVNVEIKADADVLDFEIVLERRSGGFIAGVVVDDRGESAQARVVVRRRGRVAGSATSAADGEFRVDGLDEADDYLVTAFSSEHHGERLTGIASGTSDLTLRVRRRGRIRGRVVSDEGTPVDEFEVRVAFTRSDGNRFHTKWTTRANVDGEFAIDGAEPDPVAARVDVRATGFVPRSTAALRVPPGGETEVVIVQLERGAVLRGAVTDADTGAPLLGARVRVHDRGGFGPQILDVGRGLWDDGKVWMLGMTDEKGRFELTGFEAGVKVHLAIWIDGYGTRVERGVEVTASGAEVSVALEREAVLTVEQRVAGGGGSLRTRYVVEHREERPWNSAFRASGSTVGEGDIAFDGLAAGRYRVVVVRLDTAAAIRAGEVAVELQAGESRRIEIDPVALAKRSRSIRGAVKRATRGAFVRVVWSTDPEESYTDAPVPCDADGGFEAPGLPPGQYRVFARARGKPPREASADVRVKAGERSSVELALPAGEDDR